MTTIALPAQLQNQRLTFDVATVKLDECGGQKSNRADADQLISTDQTLKQLVVLAYSVQPYQVTGPPWMESVCFDITAKYPPRTRFSDRWLMLRSPLEDRFIFTALQSTLGLTLQRQKVPVDTIVVDHIERVPTEN